MSEYINNRARRQAVLKELIGQLHQGKTVDDVKADFSRLLRNVGAAEIAEIEQALISEGLPHSEVKRLCDVHVAVFRESLDAQTPPEGTPGHPIHTFRIENEAAANVLDALQDALEALKAEPPDASASYAARLAQARERLAELREYEKHYSRKENILFPYLERHAFTGPSSVMWAIHDDVRAGWKALDELLAAGPRGDAVGFVARIEELFGPLNTAIREMFYKEENILFPTAVEKLSAEEWVAISEQEHEIGYCYVAPNVLDASLAEEVLSKPPAPVLPGDTGGGGSDLLELSVGALTAQQINLLLSHLPVDVTFVDENDAVRYFSQGPERIFPRSPAIIGRKVQNCHPPDSVHRVQQILDDFRAGRRDTAEFWIQMQGKFIHIRYFCLRNDSGEYRGTLEVSQDLAPLRALQGERRLLDDTSDASTGE
jgi:DUF438 domain-containing protein